MWICKKCLSRVDDVLPVCWQCGAREDGTVDPLFEQQSPEQGAPLPAEPPSERACPRCGEDAELGTIYAADRAELLYRPGPATWWDNFLTGLFGVGETVGKRETNAGTHISCLRCVTCRFIFFRY